VRDEPSPLLDFREDDDVFELLFLDEDVEEYDGGAGRLEDEPDRADDDVPPAGRDDEDALGLLDEADGLADDELLLNAEGAFCRADDPPEVNADAPFCLALVARLAEDIIGFALRFETVQTKSEIFVAAALESFGCDVISRGLNE